MIIPKPINRVLPEALTLLIIAIGALCFPLVSYGLEYIPPFQFSGLRVLIAGVATLFALPLVHQPILPPRDTWKWILLFSIPAVVISYGTMFLSHGGNNTLLVPVFENLQPFLAVIFASFFLHERIAPATQTVLVFGSLGILLILAQTLTSGGNFSLQSSTLAFLASLSAAGVSILAKRIKRSNVILTISAWQFIIGSIPLFILSQLFEKDMSVAFNMVSVPILLFLALVGTAASGAVWYMLLQKAAVARLSVFFFLLPALGVLFTNSSDISAVSMLEWAGILTIILGVIIGVWKQGVEAAI